MICTSNLLLPLMDVPGTVRNNCSGGLPIRRSQLKVSQIRECPVLSLSSVSCRFMLRPSAYADSHIIMVMSMIWNIWITVVYANNCHELRFRHHKQLAQADLVMVVCQETEHFVSAGKHSHVLQKCCEGSHQHSCK